MSKSFCAVRLHCGEWLGNIGDPAPSIEDSTHGLGDSNYISPNPGVFHQTRVFLAGFPVVCGPSYGPKS